MSEVVILNINMLCIVQLTIEHVFIDMCKQNIGCFFSSLAQPYFRHFLIFAFVKLKHNCRIKTLKTSGN